MLFIGTLTPVDAKGGNSGDREWYRVCLALLDLKTGKIASKGFARASPEGVDHAPTQFFDEVPAWSPDQTTSGYVRTCQGTRAGETIKAEYFDRLVASALINDAIIAYEAGRYEEALDLYRGVQSAGAGDQLRVYNGIYLANWKLGRTAQASEAFGKIVDYGLTNKRLAVKFLFKPGSLVFLSDPKISAPYPIWLSEIAKRTKTSTTCLEVSGHSSRTGPEPLNIRLSTLRPNRYARSWSAMRQEARASSRWVKVRAKRFRAWAPMTRVMRWIGGWSSSRSTVLAVEGGHRNLRDVGFGERATAVWPPPSLMR